MAEFISTYKSQIKLKSFNLERKEVECSQGCSQEYDKPISFVSISSHSEGRFNSWESTATAAHTRAEAASCSSFYLPAQPKSTMSRSSRIKQNKSQIKSKTTYN